jgi:hypothetical protein
MLGLKERVFLKCQHFKITLKILNRSGGLENVFSTGLHNT